MKVASVKAIRDAIVRGKRSGDLVLILPPAGQRPLVEVQRGGSLVGLRIILIESAGRGEILRPCIPYVGLRRLDIVCIRGSFRAAGCDLGCGLGKRRMVRFLEQGANPLFRFVVSALAKVVETDCPVASIK